METERQWTTDEERGTLGTAALMDLRQRRESDVASGLDRIPGYDLVAGRLDGLVAPAAVTGVSDRQIAYATDVRAGRLVEAEAACRLGLRKIGQAIRDGKMAATDPQIAKALDMVRERYNRDARLTTAREILGQ